MKKVVIFGYGLAGRVFHGPLLKAAPDLEVIGILTSDSERKQQALLDFPTALVSGDLDQLWALHPDLVIVAGANVTHVPLSMQALSRGINVVVDKPITPDAASAQKLAELARANNAAIFPFHNRRWDSDYATLKSVVSSGVLGEPHRFESRMQRFRLRPKGGWRDLTAPEAMGGVLYDFGPHLVDQALDLMGPVVGVQAFARTLRETPTSDDDLVLVLEHESNRLSYLVGSLVSSIPNPRFELFGTRGAARVTAVDTQEDRLKAGEIPGENWGVESESAVIEVWEVDAGGDTSYRTEHLLSGDWPRYYAEISAALHEGSRPSVSIDQAVQTMRVLDAARESVALGVAIRVNPPASH